MARSLTGPCGNRRHRGGRRARVTEDGSVALDGRPKRTKSARRVKLEEEVAQVEPWRSEVWRCGERWGAECC